MPLLIGLAPSWWYVVAANLLLGVNQGLAWSMTVVMKIDLAGPRRRGLALGLNEAAGYLGVAVTAFATGALAAAYAPRTIVWVGAAVIAIAGLLLSVFAVRDTGAHVEHEQAAYGSGASETFFGAMYENTRDPEQIQFLTGEQPANDADSVLLTAGWRHFGKGLTANFLFSSRVAQEQFKEWGVGMTLRVDL